MTISNEASEVTAEVSSERESVSVVLHNVVLKIGGKTVRLQCWGLSEATALANLVNESVARAEVVA